MSLYCTRRAIVGLKVHKVGFKTWSLRTCILCFQLYKCNSLPYMKLLKVTNKVNTIKQAEWATSNKIA